MNKNFVTLEEVARAAEELVNEGKKPTVTAVRERLGKGSRTTIAKHLNTWGMVRAKNLLPFAQHVSEYVAEITKAVAPAREALEELTKSFEGLGSWRAKKIGLPLDFFEQTREAMERFSKEMSKSLDVDAFAKFADESRKSAKLIEARGEEIRQALQANRQRFERLARTLEGAISPLASSGEQIRQAVKETRRNAEAIGRAITEAKKLPLDRHEQFLKAFEKSQRNREALVRTMTMGVEPPLTPPKLPASNTLDQVAERLERIEKRLVRIEKAVLDE